MDILAEEEVQGAKSGRTAETEQETHEVGRHRKASNLVSQHVDVHRFTILREHGQHVTLRKVVRQPPWETRQQKGMYVLLASSL